MLAIVDTVPGWSFAPGPFQDHHGGGIWVRDAEGWLCLFSTLGIE